MTPADIDNLTALALALSAAMDTTDADLRTKLQPLADAVRPIMAEAYPDPKSNLEAVK